MITNKIIIGTANVNNKYGLRNKNISIKKFKKILNLAKFKGVKMIDTSPSYSNSEKVIGSSVNKFEVITKIPAIPSNLKKQEIENWIIKVFKRSSKNLKLNQVYGLLLQNPDILLSRNSKYVYRTLLKLKKSKKLKKIGISIYNFNNIGKIINNHKIDFIQIPFNILDRRIEDKKLIKNIKKKKIELHARSIFLQGLLTKKNFKVPKKFIFLKKGLVNWNKWLKKNNISAFNACLEFVLKNKNINKLVIGFDSFIEFKKVINFKKNNINFENFDIKIPIHNLDPRKWH